MSLEERKTSFYISVVLCMFSNGKIDDEKYCVRKIKLLMSDNFELKLSARQ